jgi:hypothetical protein
MSILIRDVDPADASLSAKPLSPSSGPPCVSGWTTAGSCSTLNREIGARARSTGEVPSYFSLDQLAASLG